MSKTPLISVIMPAYNAEKYINIAIESIINQDYTNWELIILNDASKDKTERIVKKYLDEDSRIQYHKNEINIGYLKSCNILFTKTKGEFITFLDADDISLENRFSKQMQAFEDDPELVVCGTNYTAINDDGDFIFDSDLPLSYNEIKNYLPDEFNFHPNTFLFKRSLYTEYGGYRDFFDRIGCEDYDWLCRFIDTNKTISITEKLYLYRYTENSITRSFDDRRKLHSIELVRFLYKQRSNNGFDSLDKQGVLDDLINEENRLDKPFKDSPSFFYYYVSKRRFYEGESKQAIQFMWMAIKKAPLKIHYYRDLLYFIKNK